MAIRYLHDSDSTSSSKMLKISGGAKGEEKASFREVVVQNGAFGESRSRSVSAHFRVFGRQLLRMTASPSLRRSPTIANWIAIIYSRFRPGIHNLPFENVL